MSVHRQKNPEKGIITTEIVSETDRDKHVLLQMLDLHRQKVAPIDLTSMLYISCPWLEDKLPANPTELSNAFLSRLWLYHPQSRSSSCNIVAGSYGVARPPDMDEDSQSSINPLDLVAAVYMTSNSFLQQEITCRMVKCNFAVPLFLPPVYPDKNGTLLLWPFRGVLGKWKSESLEELGKCTMKNMANSRMPFVSAVRLGHCSVSKSRVLNSVLGGPHKLSDCFINRDMDGGKLPRVLSDGLVEVSWNLPSADHQISGLSRPLLMANLRGDAADFEKQVSLLGYASAVLIVFCSHFGKKERNLLASWRDNASHLILIDCSDAMEEDGEENRNEKMKQITVKYLELSEKFVIDARDADEEALAKKLRDALNILVPYVHTTNLVATAGMASDLNMHVDEDETCRLAFSEVEEVLNGMENGINKFFEEQLPLQGPIWKRLCHLQKEEGRLQNSFWQQSNLEQDGGKEKLEEELMSYKLTTGMKTFIESLCSYDMTKRAFFLSWMKVKLQVMQLDQLTEAAGEQMQASYVGLEHFLREMGLVYERYFRGPNYDLYEMFRLPYLAAELLLCGVPLEIYDGDTSVFPLNWVYSVLYEVYRQLPQYSRMRVLTTLGFYNSKTAEILSALFGVNFAKSCQSLIKGANMLLLTLPDNIRKEMDCEFLMLIVTQGLDHPQATQHEESLVHDNELATFVSGLSDVTLVNLAQDGLAGTRQNLQIAVNAFLRTKDSERRTTFQVVSEGPTKDAKIMGCIVEILTQESVSEVGTELHNNGVKGLHENLVGPWTDLSLCEESNQMYSDAALELKQSLLALFHKKATTGQPTCLGAFMEHMCNVWELVRNQNYEVKFGDKHAADTLIGLCAKLVEDEQELKDFMNQWVQDLDTRITELREEAARNVDYVEDTDETLISLMEEAKLQIKSANEKNKSGLWEYIRQENTNAALIETCKANLLRRMDSTEQQMTLDINSKIESAIIRHNFSTKLQALLTALEATLEVKLRCLLESCSNSDTIIEDKQLEEEFTSVWSEIPSTIDLGAHEMPEIYTSMEDQLKENLKSHGLKKQRIKLEAADHLRGFTVKNRHFALRSKMKRTLKHNKEVVQRFTKNLIEHCGTRVSEKVRLKEVYSDSYVQQLLASVDKGLEVLKTHPFVMKHKFEVDLKVYICSKAAESFHQLHNILKNEREEKVKFLNETKERHLQNFIYSFRKRDRCQKAAWTFTNLCLKPVALDFIYSSLERQVLDDMLANDHKQVYASPKNFHYHLLRDLLLEDNFENILEYLQSTESVCRKRIENIIGERLFGSVMLEDRRQQRTNQIFERMQRCITMASDTEGEVKCNVRLLLERICANLKSAEDVTVHQDFLVGPLFDITTHQEHFITQLKGSMAELSLSLAQEFSENADVIEVPHDLSFKLQDLLFAHVKGCDKKCPFCKTPCDLGGKEHTVHEALMHRPKGVVSYTNAGSSCLSHMTCSADMAGENQFQNRDTGGQTIFYKDYKSIYPNWDILPERPEKHRAGAYWKYVLIRYNTRFAQVYKCEPASLPEDWKTITQEEALRSLKEAFKITK